MAKRKTRSARGLSEKGARYIPHGIDQIAQPMQTAKLFKNGRSQAVRLPKEFRFEGEEVYVRREGKSIVLSPSASCAISRAVSRKERRLKAGFRCAEWRASHRLEDPSRHRHHVLRFLASRSGDAAPVSWLCGRRCRGLGHHCS